MYTNRRYLELTDFEFSVLFRAIDGSIERWNEVKENPSLKEGCPDWLSPDRALDALDGLRSKLEALL